MRRPGMLIVVGGHSRHVGKTSVIEAVLRAAPERGWIAIKVSSHSHALPRPGPRCQQSRYLAAGARRALLVKAPDDALSAAARRIDRLRARGRNVLIESNRILQHIEPDLVLFAAAPGIADWKLSSDLCLRRADAIVLTGEGPGPRSPAPVFARPDFTTAPDDFAIWLRDRLARGVRS